MSSVSLFGHVALKRGKCRACDSYAFIVDGHFRCCGSLIIIDDIKKIVRVCDAVGSRLSQSTKNQILIAQRHRCYLCGVDLRESLFYSTGKTFKRLHTEFDHFIPRSFCYSNDFENIYAMCCLCNRYKGSTIYETREAAVKEIMVIRKNKGKIDLYTDIDVKMMQDTGR